eukprot:4844318-Pleurochrysis_carterae.AAC.3
MEQYITRMRAASSQRHRAKSSCMILLASPLSELGAHENAYQHRQIHSASETHGLEHAAFALVVFYVTARLYIYRVRLRRPLVTL